jgi:hypothetical protein
VLMGGSRSVGAEQPTTSSDATTSAVVFMTAVGRLGR